MSIYPGYDDPYSLKRRGIERLSIVYGIVPVRKDGSVYKESGVWPFDDCPDNSTSPHRVAKGVVEKADRVHTTGLFEKAKVIWQRSAVGRAALSRGVARWPYSASIYTATELLEAIDFDHDGIEITLGLAIITGPN